MIAQITIINIVTFIYLSVVVGGVALTTTIAYKFDKFAKSQMIEIEKHYEEILDQIGKLSKEASQVKTVVNHVRDMNSAQCNLMMTMAEEIHTSAKGGEVKSADQDSE